MLPLHPSDPRSVGGMALTGRIGVGGMGVVYLARRPDGVAAAVKMLRVDLRDDVGHRLRFAREIRQSAAARGPFLPETLQCGQCSAPQFVALRYVPGCDLRDEVGLRGPLAEREVHALAVAVADSLARLHLAGVVHRDVSASNVRLGPDGPVLMDLGIAKQADATTLTLAGTSLGTPAWMAPERLDGRADDGPAADVWSWGLLVAYAAGGSHPYGVGPPAALAYRVVHERPLLPPLPPDLAPWVRAALAHDPAARPAAADIVAALVPDGGVEAYVAQRWARFSTPPPSPAPDVVSDTVPLPRAAELTAAHLPARARDVTAVEPPPFPAVPRAPRRPPRRTTVLLAATALAVLLAAAPVAVGRLGSGARSTGGTAGDVTASAPVNAGPTRPAATTRPPDVGAAPSVAPAPTRSTASVSHAPSASRAGTRHARPAPPGHRRGHAHGHGPAR